MHGCVRLPLHAAPEEVQAPHADHAALGQAIELVIAKNAGMTQDSIAARSGLDIKQVGALIRSQSNPTYVTLLKLSNGLDIRLGQLLTQADKLAASAKADKGIRTLDLRHGKAKSTRRRPRTRATEAAQPA